VRQQAAAGRSELGPVPPAIEEAGLEVILEATDAGGQGGLREVRVARGGGECAVVGDEEKVSQRVDHHRMLLNVAEHFIGRMQPRLLA
jgi:hypothetical protein